MVNFGHMLKDAGHTISKGSKSIGHVFESGSKTAEKAVSQVYKDTRTAVGYAGKHAVDDMDSITSSLSNPMLWIVVGGVVVVVLLNK